MAQTRKENADGVVSLIAGRLRARRRELGVSRRQLAEASGVSQRYLAQVEGGQGNVSIALLARIGDALDRPVAWFVGEAHADEVLSIAERFHAADPAVKAQVRALLDGIAAPLRAGRIALIGLRGAGKSTLGRLAGERLSIPFVELNRQIQDQAGLSVADIIALYGQEGYRRLEHQALVRLAEEQEGVILAVGGGLVAAPETFAFLKDRFRTIWLRATPQEHMARVRAQGDERPMAGNPDAMDQLKSILAAREPAYAQADAVLDTSGQPLDASLTELVDLVGQRGAGPR